MNLQEEIIIDSPIDQVFSYLNEPTNRPDYIPMLEEVILLDAPPIRLGSRYIEVSTIAGRKLKTTYQVVAMEKNEQIRVKTLKSVFPIQVEMKFQPRENLSAIQLIMDFELTGIYRLAAPLIRGIVQQQAQELLRRLKHILETN